MEVRLKDGSTVKLSLYGCECTLCSLVQLRNTQVCGQIIHSLNMVTTFGALPLPLRCWDLLVMGVGGLPPPSHWGMYLIDFIWKLYQTFFFLSLTLFLMNWLLVISLEAWFKSSISLCFSSPYLRNSILFTFFSNTLVLRFWKLSNQYINLFTGFS